MRFRMLLAVAGAILAACSGSSGPEAVAQRYVDAIIREDYAAAVAEVDTSRMGRTAVLAVLPFMHDDLTRQSGGLKTAAVKRLETPNTAGATMLVTWRGEQANITSSVVLTQLGADWKIVDMPGGAAQQPGIAMRQADNYLELPPVQLAAPTPVAYTLTVQVPESMTVVDNTTVEVVELKRIEKLNPLHRDLRIDGLSPGTYTLRLKVPGHVDSDSTVEIGGRRPDSIVLRPGERLPIDVATTVLLSNRKGDWATFATLDDNGLTHWASLGFWRVRGWDKKSRKALHVVDNTGIGKVGLDGSVEYSWRVPERLSNSFVMTWAYRPDLAEIVYVENKDVFTLKTRQGATPERWTKLGIFRSLSGWVDENTVLVNTDSQQNVLRRDGGMYTFSELAFFGGPKRIVDRRGAVRFVEQDGALFQLGPTELVNRVEIKPAAGEIFSYGWTSDNAFLLAHSSAVEPGAGSGIVAIGQNGVSRWIAPQLVSGPSYSGERVYPWKSWAFEPHGSRMVLAWHAKDNVGIYVVDAQHGATRVSNVVADAVFWPAEASLIYVIESGPDMGTWKLSPSGGQPRKLFAYRATEASATPDGELLLIANRTLWRVSGDREPELIGQEGAMRGDERFVWPPLFEPADQ